MARITQVVVTCDLEDGDVNASDSVSFTYGGKTYTLDLCRKHLDEVKETLEGFANAGHSAGRGGRGRAPWDYDRSFDPLQPSGFCTSW